MTEYTISDRILYHLNTHSDFRRLAEQTANMAIKEMNDPCVRKFIIDDMTYVRSHNYFNRYTALDCMYFDNHAGRTVLDIY